MKNTLIIFITLISSLTSQIQYGGQPTFFDDRNIDIDFLTISDQTEKIDRNFNPMVFQYGDEFAMDVDILSNARLDIDNDLYTYTLGIHSPGA